MLSKPVLYLLNNLRNYGAFHAKGEEIKKGKGSKERKQTENGAEELFVLQRNGTGSKFGNIQYPKVYGLWWHGKGSGLAGQHDEDRASTVSSHCVPRAGYSTPQAPYRRLMAETGFLESEVQQMKSSENALDDSETKNVSQTPIINHDRGRTLGE